VQEGGLGCRIEVWEERWTLHDTKFEWSVPNTISEKAITFMLWDEQCFLMCRSLVYMWDWTTGRVDSQMLRPLSVTVIEVGLISRWVQECYRVCVHAVKAHDVLCSTFIYVSFYVGYINSQRWEWLQPPFLVTSLQGPLFSHD